MQSVSTLIEYKDNMFTYGDIFISMNQKDQT